MTSNPNPQHPTHGHQHHQHNHDDIDWAAMGEQIELEGEVLAGFVHDATQLITERFAGGSVRTIVDIGSGPGVASCMLAEAFTEATVTAIDASAPLLVRAQLRAERLGLGPRLLTQVGDLDHGLSVKEPVDLVWASMMLHHLHDQEAALGAVRRAMRVGGWLAIVEFGAPLVCIPPDALDSYVELLDRCQAAVRDWLPEQLPAGPAAPNGKNAPLHAALERAGFGHVGDTTLTVELPAPLAIEARRFVVQSFTRLREIVETRLDAADLAGLDELLDPHNPHGLPARQDLFVRTGRTLTTAQAVA